MKRVISVFLAVLLVAVMMTIGASAEDALVVSLVPSTDPVIVGQPFKVTLKAPAEVGGMEGKITYDTTWFDLTNVEVTSKFVTANRVDSIDKILKEDPEGTISFTLIDGAGVENDTWVTFHFDVKQKADTPFGTATFSFVNLDVANASGRALITEDLTVDVNNLAIFAPALDVAGATVRTNGTADIRFEADFTALFNTSYRNLITEVGIIGIPTGYMAAGQELVVGGKYSGYSSKTAKITAANLKPTTTRISTKFAYSSSSATRLRTAYSARAYVKLTYNEKDYIVYSYNVDANKNISGGTSSRSCASVAKAVAAKYGVTASDAGAEILNSAVSTWTVEGYESLINTINAKIMGNTEGNY